jgi:phage tail tape-measure protein
MNKEEDVVAIDASAVNLDSTAANRDPLTGSPGSHPVGTGIGSAGAAAAGAAIGGAVGGPAGVLVGGTIGAVAGGVAGHAAGESANPTVPGLEGGEPGPAKAAIEEPDDAPGRSSLLGLGK